MVNKYNREYLLLILVIVYLIIMGVFTIWYTNEEQPIAKQQYDEYFYACDARSDFKTDYVKLSINRDSQVVEITCVGSEREQ